VKCIILKDDGQHEKVCRKCALDFAMKGMKVSELYNDEAG